MTFFRKERGFLDPPVKHYLVGVGMEDLGHSEIF
jgi:hypothetical protein